MDFAFVGVVEYIRYLGSTAMLLEYSTLEYRYCLLYSMYFTRSSTIALIVRRTLARTESASQRTREC